MQNTFLDWEFQGRRIPLALPPIAFGKNIICDFGKRKGWVIAAVISPWTLSWQRKQVHFAKKIPSKVQLGRVRGCKGKVVPK